MKIRNARRYSYSTARSILLFTGAFSLVGSLPRAIGMIGVKSGMEWVYILDATVGLVFLGALLYSLWALYQNTKNAGTNLE